MPTVAEAARPSVGKSLVSGPAPAPEGRPELRSRFRIALIVLLAAAAAAAALVLPRQFQTSPPDVVRASGRIEGRQMTVAPKDIQGRVRRLLVDEGATVTQGQLLAELEANQLDARRAALVANLATIDAQIRQGALDVAYTDASTAASVAAAEAAVAGSRAHIARAEAVLVRSRHDYDRATNLYDRGVIAGSVLDEAEMAYHTSQADLDAAQKELVQTQSNVALARASRQTIDLKRQQVSALRGTRQALIAQVAEADATLAERRVVAPANGTILSRPVEVGDVVSPGSPVFVMVDMNRLYLKVYIPEPEIAKLKLGDRADVSVDAFPGRTFAARVTKIYEQAEFTPKNVETQEERLKLVFGVELSFVHPEGVLKPGMPADGAIRWTERDVS
jgi:multidrug resistance efflux pump